MRTLRILFACFAVAAISCGLGGDDEPAAPNRAPEIYLTGGPADGDTDGPYRAHFHWLGHDPDGTVDHYRWLLTDDEVTGSLIIDENVDATLAALGYRWTETTATDSLFVVSADQVPGAPGDSLYEYGEHFLFHGQHTFFVRAVDDAGAVSPLPAHRTFTAVTIAPMVDVDQPVDVGVPGGYDDFPPDVAFGWTGADSVGDGSVIAPDSSRFALLDRGDFELDEQAAGSLLVLPDSIWSPWRAWESWDEAAAAGGREAIVRGLTPQAEYLFLVQAKDEAGAVTSHFTDGRNLRKMRVVSTIRPTLIVHASVFGVRVFREDEELHFTIAAGQRLEARWSGDAESYGSLVDGYRFGWDLDDPGGDDPGWSDWSVAHTETAGEFEDGDHSLHIECRDLSGNVVRAGLLYHVIPFTMEHDLLLVDDYDNAPSSNAAFTWPDGPEFTWGTYYHDDAQMRDWWEGILADYSGYVPARDFFRVSILQETPPIEVLAAYRRVVWETKEPEPAGSALFRVAGFIDPGSYFYQSYDYLSHWLERGGQALITGSRPVFAALPTSDHMPGDYARKGPFAFLRHLDLGDDYDDIDDPVREFLFWKQFGLDAVAKPVDAAPREIPGATEADFPTTRTFWGMTAAGYPGDELAAFPSTVGELPDTLAFRPEVYEWFADAGEFFNDPDDWEDPDDPGAVHHEFGLAEVEIYNWAWFRTALTPSLDYRTDQHLPLLTYVPADSTTRWGSDPVPEHIARTPGGEPYCETCYATASAAGHAIAVVGIPDSGRPNVLLGFSPYFLEEEAGERLIDHILVDILGLQP